MGRSSISLSPMEDICVTTAHYLCSDQHYKLGYGFMTKEEIGAMERIGRNRQFTRWLIIGCVNDQVVL